MTMSAPEKSPTSKSEPEGRVVTESPNCIDYYDEPIGDNTVRPIRSPDLLRQRPLQRPSTEPPHDKT